MFQVNSDLVMAFPTIARRAALAAVSALPENPRPCHTFSVTVAGEKVSIPRRIYHNPLEVKLGGHDAIENEVLDCLFTRHWDGFVRQERLSRITRSHSPWVPPFVIQLASEYVVEILRIIEQALPDVDSSVYRAFVQENPAFIAVTQQRISSYWNCYYRSYHRDEYPGFRILSFIESLSTRSQC